MNINFSNKNIDAINIVKSIEESAETINQISVDHGSDFSIDKWNILAKSGIFGLMTDRKFQGFDLNLTSSMDCTNKLGYEIDDSGLVFSTITQLISAQVPLLKYGTDAQKEKYLPKLVSGEMISAHAITEPNGGSDAYSMKTIAKKTDDGYVINGRKTFITNGPIADLIVVYALTDPNKGILGGVSVFLVDSENVGFRVSETIDTMGLDGSPLGELIFDDCKVGSNQLLGKVGAGYGILEYVMAKEILLIAASHLGEMQKIINRCVDYSKTRTQFGKSIGKYQAISHKIADMKISLEAAKSLVYKAASANEKSDIDSKIKLSAAKIFTSESYVDCSLNAIQIFGGNGYKKEFKIEKHLRDSVAAKIYSGSSEIHRNLIANFLGV